MTNAQETFDEKKEIFERRLEEARKLLVSEYEHREYKKEIENYYQSLHSVVVSVDDSRSSIGVPSTQFLRQPYYSANRIENSPIETTSFPDLPQRRGILASLIHSIQIAIQNRRMPLSEEKVEEIKNKITMTQYRLETAIHELSVAFDEVAPEAVRPVKRQHSDRIPNEQDLSIPPQGEVVEQMSDGPGILDDYRGWGIRRICLDGFQNHLPADAMGTACFLHFKVDGEWLTRDEVLDRNVQDKVEAIRFADDGVGFLPDNLMYLHSGKVHEEASAGQFGEGLKLLSMACVNLGVDLEIWSRNWIARARGEEVPLTNTRNNDSVEQYKKLVYDVEKRDGEPIVGSRTILNHPPQELIDFAMRLPELILGLGGVTPLIKGESVDLVDIDRGGTCFVKGVYLKDLASFFSYNFKKANVNPDRNEFNDYDPSFAVAHFFMGVKDPEVIKELFKKVIPYLQEHDFENYYDNSRPIETGISWEIIQALRGYRLEKMDKELWRNAFIEACHELYPDDDRTVLIKELEELPEDVAEEFESKYHILSLKSGEWKSVLKELGIQTDKGVLPKQVTKTIKTSLSLDYGAATWDEQRILLDACQNHLPQDSGGTYIQIRFQDSMGDWHDISEIEDYSDSNIARIKIADNGRGYDSKNLGILGSSKGAESAGKWGEGLKMLSATAVRSGIQMELRSRDWIATPVVVEDTLDEGLETERKKKLLAFRLQKQVGVDQEEFDGDFMGEQDVSSTTFIHPSAELIRQFRNLKENVLFINPPRPIAESVDTDVIATSGGRVYVKNLLIPGNHDLKYSYHFKNFDIESRDRDALKTESIRKELQFLFSNITDEEFITRFLEDCVSDVRDPGSFCWEFHTPFSIRPETKMADAWIRAFKQRFGEDAAIRSDRSVDPEELYRAEHVGLKVVTLPHEVAQALKDLRGRDGQTIASYHDSVNEAIENAVFVEPEEYTEEEQKMLAQLSTYNAFLNLHPKIPHRINTIRVYEYPEEYSGTRADGFAKYGDTVNLYREVLKNPVRASHVFFHETAHAATGAQDPQADFRDFLSYLLGALANNAFQNSIQNNQALSDISLGDVVRMAEALGPDSPLFPTYGIGVEPQEPEEDGRSEI